MAIFTSVQSGDFNDTDTWDLAGFPGPADTFVIATGGHVVTIPSGLSANTTGNISGASSVSRGELVIADGGLLTLPGNLVLTNWNHLQIDGGGELDINGNDVTVDNSTALVNKFTFVGTANNRAKVSSSVAGTGVFRRDTGGGAPGMFEIDYCDFVGLGKAHIGDNYFEGNYLRVNRTVFVGCDEITLGGQQHGNNDYIISGVDFRDDVSTTANIAIIQRTDGGAATGTGTQLIEKITLVSNTAVLLRFEVTGITNKSLIVGDRISLESTIDPNTILTDSFIRMTTASNTIETFGLAEANDNYFFSDFNNPHTNDKTIDIIDRGVIEAAFPGPWTDGGDHFLLSATATQGINYGLIISTGPGALLNAINTPRSGTYNATNCTMVGAFDNAYGTLAINENFGTYTGILNLQSNLVVSTIPNARGIFMDTAGDDQVTLMDYNAWYNVTDQYSDVTSALGKTAGVTVGYGGNDFNGINPDFVDDTRNLAAWSGLVTGTSTSTAAVEHLLKMNGYNSVSKTQVVADIVTDTPRDAVDWVRAGYAPTNILYQGTAHDGGDVGAMAVVVPSSGGYPVLTSPYAARADQLGDSVNITSNFSGATSYGADSLPDGCSINPTTGAITGTVKTLIAAPPTVIAKNALTPGVRAAIPWHVQDPFSSAIVVAAGVVTFDAVTIAAGSAVYFSPFGLLTATRNNGSVGVVDGSGSDLIINGTTIASPAVLYLSPSGELTDQPNGTPVANFN